MSRAGKRLLTEETGERIAEALEGFSAPVAVEEALAIVCNGNTAPANIASGKYLFIKNHSTLPAGGYHSTAAISAGSELNLGNVEPDEDGIANSLSDQIGTLNSKFTNYTDVTGTTDTTGNVTISDVEIDKVIKAIPIRNASGYYKGFYLCVLAGNVSATTLLLHCMDASGSPVQSQSVKIRLYHS